MTRVPGFLGVPEEEEEEEEVEEDPGQAKHLRVSLW